MKKLFILLLIVLMYSCDTIMYKEPLPKLKLNSISFPKGYPGTYVNRYKRTDTLFIGLKEFYYKIKSSKEEKENPLSKKTHIGKQLIIRTYKGGLFVNLKEYSTSKHWNTRFVIQKNNSLYLYKLKKETDIKNLIYDYTYNNKTKKYIVNPTNTELDKLIDNNEFKLSESFEKINSISYNTKTKYTVTNKKAKCLYGGCKNGYGIYRYNNGDSYLGFFKNSKRHGYGNYLWKKTNDFYSGNWENGSRNGYGEQFGGQSKNSYYGEWKNHIINGYGYKIKSNFYTETGLWQNGKLISTFLNNSNGKMTQGCISGNCTNGYGKYVWKDGNTFKGFFLNGKRHSGKFSYINGDKYKGEFSTSGHREGTGTYTYKNGNTYKGQWLNDKKNSFGILKYKKSKTFYESYNNGILIYSTERKF